MEILLNTIVPLVTTVSVIAILVSQFAGYKEKKSKREKEKWEYEEQVKTNTTNIREIKSDIKSLNKQILDLPKRIVDMIATLLNFKGERQESIVQSKSPLSLSEKGEKLAEAINADVILQNHLDAFKNMVNEKNPATEYEVQEFSKEVIYSNLIKELTPEEKKGLDDYVYEKSMSLDDLLIIFGIKLRDIILEEQGYTHLDVDKTDPNS